MIYNLEEISKMFFNSYEAKLLHLSCEYFGDEVTMIFEEDDNDINVYKLLNCFNSNINHLVDYPKNIPYREMRESTIPFRLTDWSIIVEEDLYKVNIIVHPLYLEFSCKNIEFERLHKKDFGEY